MKRAPIQPTSAANRPTRGGVLIRAALDRSLEHAFDQAAQAVARAAHVEAGRAAVLVRVEADLAALRRVVVRPEEAHLVGRRLAESDRDVRRVLPRALEVEP